MNKKLVKKILPYAGILAGFILFAFIYFSPVLDGKIISAEDSVSFIGASREARNFIDKQGGNTFWTGSMFSGMPIFQLTSGKIESQSFLTPLQQVSRLGFTGVIMLIITYLIGFFALLRSFKFNKWICAAGAMVITLSSYFFIILGAGHVTKAYAIGSMAAVIAGFVLIFNKKYLWGIILAMLFCCLGGLHHPQMTYYYFLLIGCLLIAELFIHIKEQRIKDFLIASVLFGAAVAIGIGTQFSKVQINREYVKETMRGGHSELVKESDTLNKTEGLDLDYATQWSYGLDETLTLLIPNIKGGSSSYDVGIKSNTYKTLIENRVPKKNAIEVAKHVPAYWGTQPFTSGPVYVGAIIFFLFILGLLIVKGPYKWALLAATLFSIMLAWGKNCMWLTEWFFNYFPMYNKFRAVSSILVVAEVTIPLLGFLAIKAIMDKKISKDKLISYIFIAAGSAIGICLITAFAGSIFYDFTSPMDEQLFANYPDWLRSDMSSAIIADRASLFRWDIFRSIIFILLGAGALWLFVKGKVKAVWGLGILSLLMIVDLWDVDKRFMNNDKFTTQKNTDAYFKKQPYEEYILQDKDPHFRVLNLASNTFNESRTSYYLKSVGGYHAAKLRRYQDLIEKHISKINMSVLNMLNTKYFIVPDQNKNPMPQFNPDAMGNGWFVDSVMLANTPNEECDALDSINVRNTAVLDVRFANFVKDFVPHHDSSATVTFLSYAPNQLEYKTQAATDGIVVFSEIYYPYGWHAYIDDKPVEHFRANYVLRALPVPAGEHQIRFVFDPDVLHKSEPISFACSGILYATIIGGIVYAIYQYRRKKKAKIVIAQYKN